MENIEERGHNHLRKKMGGKSKQLQMSWYKGTCKINKCINLLHMMNIKHSFLKLDYITQIINF